VGKKMAAEADHYKQKHNIESYNTGVVAAGATDRDAGVAKRSASAKGVAPK